MGVQKWEYLFLVTADKDNRIGWVNGEAVPDWKKGPHFSQYCNELGEQGWELVAYLRQDVYPYADRILMKRPK